VCSGSHRIRKISRNSQPLPCPEKAPGSQESDYCYFENAPDSRLSHLEQGRTYNPELYKKADMPPKHREIPVDQAIFILQQQGYLVTKATVVT